MVMYWSMDLLCPELEILMTLIVVLTTSIPLKVMLLLVDDNNSYMLIRVFEISPDSRALQFLKVKPLASSFASLEYLTNEVSPSTTFFSKVKSPILVGPPLLLIKMRLSVFLILLFLNDKFCIVRVPSKRKFRCT